MVCSGHARPSQGKLHSPVRHGGVCGDAVHRRRSVQGMPANGERRVLPPRGKDRLQPLRAEGATRDAQGQRESLPSGTFVWHRRGIGRADWIRSRSHHLAGLGIQLFFFCGGLVRGQSHDGRIERCGRATLPDRGCPFDLCGHFHSYRADRDLATATQSIASSSQGEPAANRKPPDSSAGGRAERLLQSSALCASSPKNRDNRSKVGGIRIDFTISESGFFFRNP